MEIKLTKGYSLYRKRLLLIIMRTFIFLCCATVFAVMPNNLVSQNSNIKIVAEESLTIDEVFDLIMEQTEYKFFYEEGIFRDFPKVQVKKGRISTNRLLKQSLAPGNLSIKVTTNNAILISEKSAEGKLEGQKDKEIQLNISGTISDENGTPLPGANILEKGTTNGTQANFDGNFSIDVSNENAILVVSYLGYEAKELNVKGQTSLTITLSESAAALDEIVVVGYGKKKKVNLTGAISVANKEDLENRPVSNVQQALQGLVPNLIIAPSASGGEPGSEMSMNIRGLQSIEGNNAPLVLVDNIPMQINDVDPNDIESISVLKDAASTAIYGSRAAYGVILITTKTGNTKGINVSYSTNFGMSSPLNWPDLADTMDFALTMNEAAINAGGSPWLNDERLSNLAKNIANPGSATETYPTPNGLSWDEGTMGIQSSANTDWKSIIFKKASPRLKHNLSVSGGNEKINYYLAGGYYDEDGILRYGGEYFKRYNLDAKISAQTNSWLELSLLVKYKRSVQEFPWGNEELGRGRIFDMITKIKPTMGAKYPGTDIWNVNSRITEWQAFRDKMEMRQLVISPRVAIEPIKGWVTNLELNYRTNDNFGTLTGKSYSWIRPNGELVYTPPSEGTKYNPTMQSNSYLSPNIYSNYTKSFGKHNLTILAGYQQEVYKYQDILAASSYLLSDASPSISTAVGESTVDDNLGHWATQSVFGRLGYNFNEKYLLEVNTRIDGSSRFEKKERWGTFPSFSAGWIISKENFYPLKNQIEFLKFRGSYGSLGNQNVDNYLYVPTLPVSQSLWLFNNQRKWTVGTPDITSVNLTWEKVSTLDFGLDLSTLNNRLGMTFDWYQSLTTNLVGPGVAVPAILGTSVPKINEGEISTRGWEMEISWKDRVNENFSYGFRGVLSDNQSKVTQYNNPTKILNTYYEGKVLGEIWGLDAAGLYQNENDITEWGIDQSFIFSGGWNPGDVKYIDQDGDREITIGNNTLDNSGDLKVIGNDTPRFQYGFNANASWKGLDISFLVQGVAKRELDLRGLGTFRGPSNGPYHATVYKGHMDYFRDETSPLGANFDAYFPRPYGQYIGENGKNYNYPTDRYLQNGAYLRLKNVQLGFTIPSDVTRKFHVSNMRIYLSGENLLTITDLMFFDPETFSGSYSGSSVGKAYPLSRTISMGFNINF